MSIYLYDRAKEATPMERMFACYKGEKTDRVPVEVHPRWAALEYLGVNILDALPFLDILQNHLAGALAVGSQQRIQVLASKTVN